MLVFIFPKSWSRLPVKSFRCRLFQKATIAALLKRQFRTDAKPSGIKLA